MFYLVLLTLTLSVNICERRWAEKPEQSTGYRRFIFFFSPRLALGAQCHVRLAWLIKRLLCRKFIRSVSSVAVD